MKTGWLILLVAALLGVAGFAFRLVCGKAEASCTHCVAESRDSRTALAWIKTEFHLDEEEFQKICSLHESYLPKCDAMCERMMEAGTRLSSILTQKEPGMSPEAEAALRDYQALRTECQRATLDHLTETARVMKPEAGRAFLQKVLPHLLTTNQHVSEVTR